MRSKPWLNRLLESDVFHSRHFQKRVSFPTPLTFSTRFSAAIEEQARGGKSQIKSSRKHTIFYGGFNFTAVFSNFKVEMESRDGKCFGQRYPIERCLTSEISSSLKSSLLASLGIVSSVGPPHLWILSKAFSVETLQLLQSPFDRPPVVIAVELEHKNTWAFEAAAVLSYYLPKTPLTE